MNSKSSVEAEIVTAIDYFGHIVWCVGFMNEQGYPISTKLFYQDNMRVIRIGENFSG